MRPIIEVSSLSKQYRLGGIGPVGLKDGVRAFLGGQRKEPETFWALRDASFEVQEGEAIGIIGKNGAGKSTLLKLLSRITKPTSGRAILRGRVISLLEVGTGFHPDLSGRENIYLNGAILGMKRPEIAARFDEIVDFAGIGPFLDTPVKRYSSGMYVRLAFSVAAHIDPEILIVDEVLAVGDAEFQKKCLGRMQDVSQRQGRTVLFVSHNLGAVRKLCGRAMLLEGGRIVKAGTAAEVIQQYSASAEKSFAADLDYHPHRAPSMKPHFRAIRIMDASGEPCSSFAPEQKVRIAFDLRTDGLIPDPRIGIGFTDGSGERVFAVATYLSPDALPAIDGPATVLVDFNMPAILPSRYQLDISFSNGTSPFLDEIHGATAIDVAETNYLGSAFPFFPGMGTVMVRSTWQVLGK